MRKTTEPPTVSERALSVASPTRRPVPVIRRVADREYHYWLPSLTDAEHQQALRLMAHLPKSMLSRDMYVTAARMVRSQYRRRRGLRRLAS